MIYKIKDDEYYRGLKETWDWEYDRLYNWERLRSYEVKDESL